MTRLSELRNIPERKDHAAGGQCSERFLIRDAMPSDARLIAGNILAGMGYDVFSGQTGKLEVGDKWLEPAEAVELFREICLREDTLYSWKRTRVACVGGEPVGTLTAYPSDDYLTLRKQTWGQLGAESSEAEPECCPGEFYLDSLAILPEFRRKVFEWDGTSDRIGHLLLLDGIEIARRKGLHRVSLIVDESKPRLRSYYSAIGFRSDGKVLFFGHLYDRLVREL